MKHSGLSASKIVKLYSPDEVEDDDDDQSWIRLSYGKRFLGLRKRRDRRCIFLNKEGKCSVYRARPMTCRIFPVNFVVDDDDRIECLELADIVTDKFINCRLYYGEKRPVSYFESLASRADRELVQFRKKIAKWNRLGSGGRKDDFLAFMGLGG
jgi:Fe-S-cluster containining protein